MTAAVPGWPPVSSTIVAPSGADFDTRSLAINPVAPTLCSTTTGCFRRSDSLCPRKRLMMSVLPPAASSRCSASASASIIARKRRDSSSRMACLILSIGSAIGDGVLEDADLVDLDLDPVARLHPERRVAPGADAAGCPGHQHVAGS